MCLALLRAPGIQRRIGQSSFFPKSSPCFGENQLHLLPSISIHIMFLPQCINFCCLVSSCFCLSLFCMGYAYSPFNTQLTYYHAHKILLCSLNRDLSCVCSGVLCISLYLVISLIVSICFKIFLFH